MLMFYNALRVMLRDSPWVTFRELSTLEVGVKKKWTTGEPPNVPIVSKAPTIAPLEAPPFTPVVIIARIMFDRSFIDS